jgi:hypothetical protein
VLCLIIVPILVFMLSFKIHFMVLSRSGPGDAQMSSLFQAGLEGNDFYKNPLGESFSLRFVLSCFRAELNCFFVFASSVRNRLRLENHAEEYGLGRRTVALARPDVPDGLDAAAGYVLSLQG